MASVLINFFHPAFEKSRINRALLEGLKNIPDITVRDLYEEYPDFRIDVKREQDFLLAHSTVVFQHPLYWYNAPALMKEWTDLVLEYNFAYGPEGNRLNGKYWAHALTMGGPEEAYQVGGYNRFTIEQLLAPWDQTAHLCGMQFLPPFKVHSSLRLDPVTEISRFVHLYREWIQRLAQKGRT